MTGLVKLKRFGAVAAGAALLASSIAAQAAEPTRNKVRMRILDKCVIAQSGRLPLQGAGPECRCYAAKITKAMTDEEVADYRRSVPRRLSDASEKMLAACQ